MLAFRARIAFFDTGGFSAQFAQVIKFRAANTTTANHVNMVNNSRVKRENAFDADAEADFSDSYGFARAAVFAGNYDAFKNLQTFLVAFLDADVYLQGVARLERGNVFS